MDDRKFLDCALILYVKIFSGCGLALNAKSYLLDQIQPLEIQSQNSRKISFSIYHSTNHQI